MDRKPPGTAHNCWRTAFARRLWRCVSIGARAALWSWSAGLWPGGANAQPTNLSQWVTDTWSGRDGLPQGSILALHEDPRGWLWLGTQCCLVRFDGARFHVLEEELEHFGQYSFVRAFNDDAGDGFWAAFVGGVGHFDGQQFTWYGTGQGLTHPFVYALAGAADPWVGTGGDGVWQLQNGQFVRDPAFAAEPRLSGKINDLALDERGTLWAATETGLIHRQAGQTWEVLAARETASEINQLTLDPAGGLWLATQAGLEHYPRLPGLSTSGLAGTPVSSVMVDRAGHLWAGTDGAVHRYDGKTWQALAVAGRVNAMLEDSAGNIWLGTDGGLTRLKPGNFVSYGRAEGLSHNAFFAVLARRQGGVWLIDASGEVGRLDARGYVRVGAPGTVAGSSMLGMTETADGALWIANGTLSRFHMGRWQQIAIPGGGASLVEPAADGLWLVQTQSDGTSALLHLPAAAFADPDRALQAEDFKPVLPQLPMQHTQRLFLDSRQRLWLATGGTGLWRVSDGEAVHFGRSEGLPDDIVYGITEDPEGSIWLATRAGIARVKDDRITDFASVDGTPTRSPVHIHLDRKDRFWITADDGIHVIARAQFSAAATDPGASIRGRLFDSGDGLRSVVVSWRRNGFAVAATEELYFATTRGLSRVDTGAVARQNQPPGVVIEAITLGDQRLHGQALTIRDRRQHLALRFTAPDLSDAEDLQFRTRLRARQGNTAAPWSPASDNRSAQFSNLAPGNYLFEVSARHPGQQWSTQTAAVAISVPPYLHERRSIQFGVALGLLLLILIWAKARLRRAKRSARMLQQRVAERTAQLSEEVEVRKAAQLRATELAQSLEARVRERTAELELAEMAVRRSEARFALAVSGAEDGIWDWDINLNTLYLSPRWKAILGYPDREFTSTINSWLEAVHEDDIEQIRDLLVFAEGSENFRYEYRIRHRQGHYLWVLTRGVLVRDAQGAPMRAAGSQTDISLRKATELQLRRSLTEDAVTGLPNRTLFADRLGQALLRGRHQHAQVAVVHLDIDHFREVNEECGRAAGDEVLRQIAGRITAELRVTDSVARVGNDEFAILLTEVADKHQANQAAERLRAALADPFTIDGRPRKLTCSIGLKLGARGETTVENFLLESELAVAQAKSAGGGQVSVFNDSLNQKARERKRLEAELKRALDQGQFVLHYQPLICLASGAVVGVEALARWEHPERGLLTPNHFISLLEACGLIVPFSSWVLHSACAQARTWAQALPSPVRISINVPAHQLNDLKLYDEITQALTQASIPAHLLGIEIVESSVLETREDVIDNLRRLRADGVQISIDDFGTGYSAFSYLNRLPVDHVKIDRFFSQRIPADAKAVAICSTLLDMVDQLGLTPVVEGIETEAQIEFLRGKHAPIIQGFYFSRPMSAAACTSYLLGRLRQTQTSG